MSKNLSPKILLTYALLLLGSIAVKAQVTTNGGSGLAATYTSLDAAITALNAATITSPVTITLTASNPQTAPAGGYVISAQGTSGSTITFVGNNNTITASNAQAAGSITDAVFKLVGADYVTIGGFSIMENTANTITDAATNNMTEFGIGVFHATSTNGAQNNTITNCTIKLVRTYQNTFGIFSHSNVSSTDVAATSNVAGVGGNNTGLTIQANAISDVNTGIACIAGNVPDTETDNLLIGGSTPALGNTITNFGGTTLPSTYLQITPNVIAGIYIRFSKTYTISNNTLTSNPGTGIITTTAGSVHGIYIPAAAVQPTEPGAGVLNIISNNTLSIQAAGITSGAVLAGSQSLYGIRVDGGAFTYTGTELQITGNNFTSLTHSVSPASGPVVAISNTVPALLNSIDNNKFTNLSINTTGTVTLISNNLIFPTGCVQSASGNSIVTALNKTGAGGFLYAYHTAAGSPSGITTTQNNNNFSNITVTGATTIELWRNRDGAGTASGPTKTVKNNIFSNITGGTSPVSVMILNASSPTSEISDNTISNVTGAGAVVGISVVANDNGKFFKNTISGLSSTGASLVSGINLSGTATANTPKVYQNKVYDLTSNNAGGSVNGIVVGFATGAASSANISIYNNLVGDLKAPIANNDLVDVIRGININTPAVLSTIKVYFNTVYINATSSGANFSTTGIYHAQSATATTAVLDLRNNIIINTSTAIGAGASTVAFRRSAVGLDNYATTSNNNMFYAGVPSATNLIYSNGTAANQTLADFKALVTTRETASQTENTVPAFVSTSGASAGFLHITPGSVTVCESKAGTGSGITDDYDGDARSGTLPDIGADEFAGVLPITLSSFTGTKQSVGNVLSWTTSTELNNTGFELQRSADGTNFSALAFVPTKADNGNSNSNLNYSFTDKKSVTATGYYRLKQIDKDGKNSFSAIVLIKGNKTNNIEFTSIYPNPAVDNLNLIVASPKAENISFIVSDISGKVILRQQASVVSGDNTIRLNVSNLAKGTYSIKAICADGCETAISKFIKQ